MSETVKVNMSEVGHTFLRDGHLVCDNCGTCEFVVFPIRLDTICDASERFVKEHTLCMRRIEETR